MSLADRVKSSGAKILVVDMERLVGLARVWDQKTNFVPATNFVRLPMTLCFAAKWYGSKTTEFHAAWDGGFDAMVQRSWEMYDEANIVVTYNGRRFDNLHFAGDWLKAGLTPPSPWKDVDLYQSNRFGYTSRSLNHLCQQLGLDVKSGKYDMDMAEACMDGDEKAQRRCAATTWATSRSPSRLTTGCAATCRTTRTSARSWRMCAAATNAAAPTSTATASRGPLSSTTCCIGAVTAGPTSRARGTHGPL
jgi:hypothetical protein